MAKVKVFLKVGQTSRSRSLGQKFWYPWKGLITSNVHMKYESPTSSGTRLKFFKRRSKFKVKVTRSKISVPMESLVTRNTHVKYERSTYSSS